MSSSWKKGYIKERRKDRKYEETDVEMNKVEDDFFKQYHKKFHRITTALC